MPTTELVGLLASLTALVVGLPQALRVWGARRSPESLRAVPLGTPALSLLGSAPWAAYGLLVGSPWVGAPALVTVPVALLTVALVVRGRRVVGPAVPVLEPIPAGF